MTAQAWVRPATGPEEEAAAWYELAAGAARPDVVDWYDELADGCPPGVLDVGAGGGRLAVPLALRGREVVCVEPSPGMRAALTARLADHPELQRTATVVPVSAEHLDLPGYRAGLVVALGVTHHLAVDGRAVFQVLRRHLHPEGRLVVTLFPPETDDLPERETSRRRLGRTELVTTVQREVPAPGRVRYTYGYRLFDGGRLLWEDLAVSERAAQRADGVRAALADAGFDTVQELPATDWSAHPSGTRLVLRAVRR